MINTYGSKYTTRKKYDKTVCNEFFLKKIMPASSKFQKVGLKNYSLIFFGGGDLNVSSGLHSNFTYEALS